MRCHFWWPLKSHKFKVTLVDMKCVSVRLSGNTFTAKMKLFKILDHLLTYTPVMTGWVSNAFLHRFKGAYMANDIRIYSHPSTPFGKFSLVQYLNLDCRPEALNMHFNNKSPHDSACFPQRLQSRQTPVVSTRSCFPTSSSVCLSFSFHVCSSKIKTMRIGLIVPDWKSAELVL